MKAAPEKHSSLAVAFWGREYQVVAFAMELGDASNLQQTSPGILINDLYILKILVKLQCYGEKIPMPHSY